MPRYAVIETLEAIKAYGLESLPVVTGNMKHFPDADFILSPSEMMRIINNDITAR